jgi:DNA-binding IclR family transcriptional regulator
MAEVRSRAKREAGGAKEPTTLQTLDRGLQALAVIARHSGGVSIAELAAHLEVHRTIAYRLVNTLEAHGFVTRDRGGQLYLGVALLTLALGFEPQLRALARPLLRELSEKTHATAFVSVAQGADCVAIVVTEPEEGVLRVGYRVGSRHPLTVSAAGTAILAGRPERADDSEAVREARRSGFSVSRSQLQRGAVGVASALTSSDGKPIGFEASIGVVAFEDLDVETASVAVTAYARKLSASVG